VPFGGIAASSRRASAASVVGQDARQAAHHRELLLGRERGGEAEDDPCVIDSLAACLALVDDLGDGGDDARHPAVVRAAQGRTTFQLVLVGDRLPHDEPRPLPVIPLLDLLAHDPSSFTRGTGGLSVFRAKTGGPPVPRGRPCQDS